MPTNAGKCPHCGRRRGACWIMPCLELSEILARDSLREIKEWAGPNLLVSRPSKGGKSHARP